MNQNKYNMAKRNICFYTLQFINGEEVLPIKDILQPLTNYIVALKRVDRKLDMLDEKFGYVENSTFIKEGRLCQMLLKSAKHSYRAPLVDKNTMGERPNPKTMNEGELNKTHLMMKFVDGDAIVAFETGRNLFPIKMFVNYLNVFLNKYKSQNNHISEGHFEYQKILRDDFREILDNMQRVKIATVYMPKQYLGSDALNFSEQIEDVREEIELTLKSKRCKNIKVMIYDLLRGNNQIHGISRIKVEGKLPNGNANFIDTDSFMRKETIEVSQDTDTGEYHTEESFTQLKLLLNSF